MRDGSDNPARPAAGVRLCAVEEIADPGSRGFRFRVENRLFAGFLVREGAAVRGFVDQCPHAGWPLGYDDRYLTRGGEHILCAGHGALFSLQGEGVTVPCLGERLTAWPVEVRDGAVFTA